jgi:hypothetical protein
MAADKDRDGRSGSAPARHANTGRVTSAGTPGAARGTVTPARTSDDAEIADFLGRVKAMTPAAGTGRRGRLVFAMDATMSREPTWDMALSLQADMFGAVKAVGGLDVQLVYFRGHDECRSSKWVSDPEALARLMTTVRCQGGRTQIGRVLQHIRNEAGRGTVNAAVYVGDCMEENIDELAHLAGEIGLLGVPVFLFQEGGNQRAQKAFREVARLTRGAYCRLAPGAAAQLRELLSAVAVYAAGGRAALEDLRDAGSGGGAQVLLQQLGKPA